MMPSSGNMATIDGDLAYEIGDGALYLGDDDLDMAELVGDDGMYDLSGPIRGNTRAARQLVNREIAKREIADAALVRPRRSMITGTLPLGFEFLNIAANATASVTTRPQTLFKPMRLVVGQTIAPFFILTDLKVGNRSQFPSSSPIPCETFSQNGFGVGVGLETVQAALDLTLVVQNIGPNQLDFRAAIIGKSVG